MQNHDSDIDLDNLPNLQTEKREDSRPVSEKAMKSARLSAEKNSASSSNKLIAVLFIVILGLFFISFQLYSEANKLNIRVEELEKKLSSTGESLNQSGVQLQVSLKELKDKQNKLENDIDKFWASSWKQSQTDMQNFSKNINALTNTKNAHAEKITLLETTVAAYRPELDVLNAKAETLSSVDAAVKLQAKTIAENKTDLKAQIVQLQSADSAIKKKQDESSAWIESNNAFRQQTNSSLSRLEQQVKALQPVPK